MTVRTCSRPRCDLKGHTRGLCHKHYRQFLIERARFGTPSYIPGDRARIHILALGQAGVRPKQIATLTRISHRTVTNIADRKYLTVRVDIEQRLLALPVPDTGESHRILSDGARVDGTGTVRRLRALVAVGHSQKVIAARMGSLETYVACLVAAHSNVVAAVTARRVEAVFNELAYVPLAQPNSRAVLRAARMGWAPPLAWDDDTINDPDARPYQPRDRQVRFVDRYTELVDIGVPAGQIPQRMGITACSVARKLTHHDMDIPAIIRALAADERYGVSA